MSWVHFSETMHESSTLTMLLSQAITTISFINFSWLPDRYFFQKLWSYIIECRCQSGMFCLTLQASWYKQASCTKLLGQLCPCLILWKYPIMWWFNYFSVSQVLKVYFPNKFFFRVKMLQSKVKGVTFYVKRLYRVI